MKIYSKCLDPRRVMTSEFGAALCSASAAVKRPVSVLLNKNGAAAAVFVGDAHEIDISSFFRKRRDCGRGIKNYRLVHTHTDGRGLTENDKFTLINERLEMIGVIKMPQNGSGSGGGFEIAYPLLPNADSTDSEKWETAEFTDCGKVDIDLENALLPIKSGQPLENSRRAIADDGHVLLVGTGWRASQSEAESSLEELKNLAASAGKNVLSSVIRPVKKNSGAKGNTVIGERNLRDIFLLAKHKGAGAVVFDKELTPSEASEIQSRTDMKIVDRTQLILEIFSLRASSREAKIQVKLAELKYAFPRLSGKGIQMSQPGAGIGTRGPGEKALEKERRLFRRRIKDLERRTEGISGRRERTRKNRRRHTKLVSLVGYTNAGKSTLFSALAKERTEIADRMFSTLGTKTRRIYSPGNTKLLLTDTVGFIKDLPRDLTAAFRATLEELGEASLLLHVADASDPLVEDKIDAVERIIDSMGFGEVPKLLVFNKTDKAQAPRIKDLSLVHPGSVFTSALARHNLGEVVSRAEIAIRNPEKTGTCNLM